MTRLVIGEHRGGDPSGGELDLLRVYLDDLGWHPLLDRQSEVRLSRLIEDGETAQEELDRHGRTAPRRRAELRVAVAAGNEARDEFTNANLRLVVSIAKRYQHHGVDLADLIQEGNVGLMRAIDRFDWRRGYKFSTYATWWIRKAVVQALNDCGSAVRLPRHRRDQARELANASERLEHSLGHSPGTAELAAETGIRAADVVAITRAAARVVSLSSPVDEDGNELGDLVADPRADTDGQATAAILPREIADLLTGLSPSAAKMVRLRYGVGGEIPHTAAEVAAILSISPERVRQVETRALAALRHRISGVYRAS